jgi:large subunit ribosomal protein L3
MGLIGRKLGMTQVFAEDGERIPVTAIQVGPCYVVGVRTPERDGYAAVQVGFEEKPARLARRPELGSAKKAGLKPVRHIREFRLPEADVAKFEVGKQIRIQDVFETGTPLDIEGTSKGKGYQGVMKRHGMSGTKGSHGVHEYFRHGGSIGCRLTPGRVHKGKRMSGHMGDERKTVQNLELVEVLADQNVVLVRGGVPGARDGYLLVQNAVKKAVYKRKRHEVIEEKSKNPMKASKAGAGAAKPKK